ncbi:penicillin-binding protein 1A [Zobellella maritima]|uniref:penicillin-binding protein 1A n=1 Tax=Zobellella maritima TaxID=2059725 RepID=UPI000E3044CD|nr:PBP1A family penicillin-binding protein [Zobellella maritima]
MLKWLSRLFLLCLFLVFSGTTAVFALYQQVKADLPDVSALREIQLDVPLRILSQDGELISQFGEQKRDPVTLAQLPPLLIDAFLATEDARFYEHPGIDPIGIARAAMVWLTTGEKRQGASTITQQVARNFFLSREKTVTRKVKEIFLALHIESLLTKGEILELYLNKIPLGNRAHGVSAAAQVYYGKTVDQLTLAEMAMIAGLPQAPSLLNPIRSPERAAERRALVLGRMLELGKISRQDYQLAMAAPVAASYHGTQITLSAPYLAEMAHQFALARYGESAYGLGLNIYTTVHAKEQEAANRALTDRLLAYDLRHGYRGAETQLWQGRPWEDNRIQQYLDEQPGYWPLEPAVVTAVQAHSATIVVKEKGKQQLSWDGMKWARRYISDSRQGHPPRRAGDILESGAQIWVRPTADGWLLSQIPEVNGALVSLRPSDGAITALVGGFNFSLNKFNRAEQARRQMGSNIKPFIYSAALDQGFGLSSLIDDAPIDSWDPGKGVPWRPRNSPNVYDGPIRIREALARSKNVVSIRLLRETGIDHALTRLQQFGFDTSDIPPTESLALGSPSATPLEMAAGYATFANGGLKVEPYVVERIEDARGNIIYRHNPVSQRIISEENAFLITDALTSAIRGGSTRGKQWNGTGRRAGLALARRDIAGKTGTTNRSRDAWFSGFTPDRVATAWVGFDDFSRPLGRTAYNPNLPSSQVSGGEFGASTALPIWIDYMKAALAEFPVRSRAVPANLYSARIDTYTGEITTDTSVDTREEYFEIGKELRRVTIIHQPGEGFGERSVTEELF